MKFKTKAGGVEVELKDYITGREFREIQQLFLDGAEFVGGQMNAKDPKVFTQMQDAFIKNVVVSIGGKTENILDEVLDLRKEDYEEIMERVNEITGSDEKKTTEGEKN